jgi:hypothetical protein
MTYTHNGLIARQALVNGLMALLLLFWIVPASLLASLLSYEELKKATPWLVRWIDKAPSIRALVQNTLPSTALILFNGLLPMLLESECNANVLAQERTHRTHIHPTTSVLSYIEGHKARSLVEFSLLKK